MSNQVEQDWNNVSWLGSRRVLIRQSLKLSVLQRLQALEDMTFTSQTLASLKKHSSRVNESTEPYASTESKTKPSE